MEFPTHFHAIVVREHDGEKEIYAAIALEWYLVGSGPTIIEARKNLEYMLCAQRALLEKHPDSQVQPAPQEYQDVRDTGARVHCKDPLWIARLGGEQGQEIWARFVIDMTKSAWKVVKT